ncbi:hypothetical protein D9M68_824060 [compost metagenome]
MALAVAVATGRDDVLRPIPAPLAARQKVLGGAPEEPGPAHGHAVSAGKTFYAHQPHGGAAIEAAAGLAEIGGEAVLAEGVGHGPVLGIWLATSSITRWLLESSFIVLSNRPGQRHDAADSAQFTIYYEDQDNPVTDSSLLRVGGALWTLGWHSVWHYAKNERSLGIPKSNWRTKQMSSGTT